MTIVKVGTSNSLKREAIESALRHYFDELKVVSEEVESGVPEQPTNDLIFKGAENRLNALAKENYDILVACEGGLLHIAGRWFCVHAVLIEDKKGKRGLGISQGFEIPNKYLERAAETSVAEVLKDLFNGGGLGDLTRGYFSREDMIKDATIMALTRILNEKW